MKIIIVLLILIIPNLVFADTEAKILATQVKGEMIEVFSQYMIDGIIVQSRYPQDLTTIIEKGYPTSLVGKNYFITRYTANSFIGLSNFEIQQFILNELSQHIDVLIINKFNETSPETQKSIKEGKASQIFNDVIKDITNQIISKTSTKILIDTDVDGINDKEWVVKSDGSKIEKDYTP